MTLELKTLPEREDTDTEDLHDIMMLNLCDCLQVFLETPNRYNLMALQAHMNSFHKTYKPNEQ